MKKKHISLLFLVFVVISCTQKTNKYPETKQSESYDMLWNKKIKDPYRWLEDETSEETKNWVDRQILYTKKILLNYKTLKEEFKEKLESLYNYEKIKSPFFVGNDLYYYKNDKNLNHYILYKLENNKDVEFINPNFFSKDGTVSISNVSFSKGKKSKYVAYQISKGGSDWKDIIIKDIEKNMIIDSVKDVKFSSISWKKDEGFYYSTYKKNKSKNKLSAKTSNHLIKFHKIGNKKDNIVFGEKESQQRRYVYSYVSENSKYLFIYASVSTSGNELYVLDLLSNKQQLKKIYKGFKNEAYIAHTIGSDFYIVTNENAPNRKVIKVNFNNLNNKKEIIPTNNKPIKNVVASNKKLVINYLNGVNSEVFVYSIEGKKTRKIEGIKNGVVTEIHGDWNKEKTFLTFTNYLTPNRVYEYSSKTNVLKEYFVSKSSFNPDKFISKTTMYKSKDNKNIPITIVHSKGTKLNGKNPTLLYGYGGFNISILPKYIPFFSAWIEKGGVLAVANLRGGGEFGDTWHKEGIKLKKQNVFDDFIAAAEYLIKENYTSSKNLAIYGRSNGGLLVGAVMTQRPDLMKVAIPFVGVMDMLRYHKFTSGAGWAYDFGTVDDSEEMFNYIYSYSPLHNIKNTKYPATIITTADHDDRVVPAHSYKFAAELQKNQTGKLPILIRIDKNAGHGKGKPKDMIIEEWADVFSFTWKHLTSE